MKKLIATLMTVLFLGSTTGMVFAQGTTASTTPVVKTSHKVKKSKKMKKAKKAVVAPSTTPAAK